MILSSNCPPSRQLDRSGTADDHDGLAAVTPRLGARSRRLCCPQHIVARSSPRIFINDRNTEYFRTHVRRRPDLARVSVVWRTMTELGVFTPDQDEVLSAAIAGVPRVIELIATVPERSEAAPAGAPNAGAGVDPGLNLIIRQPLASASASFRHSPTWNMCTAPHSTTLLLPSDALRCCSCGRSYTRHSRRCRFHLSAERVVAGGDHPSAAAYLSSCPDKMLICPCILPQRFFRVWRLDVNSTLQAANRLRDSVRH